MKPHLRYLCVSYERDGIDINLRTSLSCACSFDTFRDPEVVDAKVETGAIELRFYLIISDQSLENPWFFMKSNVGDFNQEQVEHGGELSDGAAQI